MPAKAIVRRAFRWRWLDGVLPALFFVSLAVMCFVGGAYVAEFNLPLYKSVLQPSFRGLRALDEQRELDRHWIVHGWHRAHDQQTGITVYNPEPACNGYTLYATSGESTSAQLISMTGEVVHRWRLPFREVWAESPHLSKKPVPEERIHWHRVRLFPNGDLIANYVAVAGTPYGYGLAKMDKDSKLIWRYSECAHHDFDVDDTGRVYALRHSIERQRVKAAPHLRTPMLKDYVVVLSPEGEELQRIAVFDAFAKSSKFRDYLASISSNEKKGDHTHANEIDVISEAFAKKHDFCSAGDVMISLRNPGLLAIMNLEREEIVWAARGIWELQHDCDPLENGNVLLFDNKGNSGSGGASRILEWNPSSGAIQWCYRGSEEKPFESLSRGSQQLLPNGNVLVTESNNGRLFEVTRDHQIVWEFCNPQRLGKNNELVAVVCSGVRYAPNELTFLNPGSVAESTAKRFGAAAKSTN